MPRYVDTIVNILVFLFVEYRVNHIMTTPIALIGMCFRECDTFNNDMIPEFMLAHSKRIFLIWCLVWLLIENEKKVNEQLAYLTLTFPVDSSSFSSPTFIYISSLIALYNTIFSALFC